MHLGLWRLGGHSSQTLIQLRKTGVSILVAATGLGQDVPGVRGLARAPVWASSHSLPFNWLCSLSLIDRLPASISYSTHHFSATLATIATGATGALSWISASQLLYYLLTVHGWPGPAAGVFADDCHIGMAYSLALSITHARDQTHWPKLLSSCR